MAFWFPDVESLRVLAGRARMLGGHWARVHDGVVVSFEPPPTPDVVTAWIGAGVRHEALPADAVPVLHWAEVVPLESDPTPDEREVLFILQPGESWTRVAAELLRLGCTEQLLRRTDAGWVIRADSPSYYTISGCIERNNVVLVRQLPQVWVPWGRRHPMADQLVVPAGAAVWLTRPWQLVEDAGWVDVLSLVDIEQPARPPPSTAVAAERLRVRLRLSRAVTPGVPTMWLTDRATVERLVWTLPEAEVGHLEFAALEDGTMVVRCRPGVWVSLELPEPYVQHQVVPGLFVAAGRSIEPPLREGVLRTVLSPGPGQVGWLREQDGALVLVRVAESAFHLLGDWVLYEADQVADAVRAWMGTALFYWTPPRLPASVEESSHPPKARPDRGPAPAVEPALPVQSAPVPPSGSVPEVAILAPPAVRPAVESGRTDLEARLFALQGILLEDPTRTDLWPRLATLYSALRRHHDAALCWARAVWGAQQPGPIIEAWASTFPPVTTLPPGHQFVDVVAGCVAILAGSPDRSAAHWLSVREHVLDVRTRWLVHQTLARRDADPLALARARDGVLASLRSGLVVGRDLPDFMRMSAPPEERVALEASLSRLRQALDQLAPTGSCAAGTRMYAHHTLAWAQATLGFEVPPVEWTVGTDDPLHIALNELYTSRVEYARLGLPPETPPPADVVERLSALDRFASFKLARLREQSVVLAHPGQSDPFLAWANEATAADDAIPQDEVGDAVRRWFGEANPPSLRRALGALVALETDVEPWLVQAIRLSAAWEPDVRVPLLEEALSVAAAVGSSHAAEMALAPLEDGLRSILGEPRQLEAALRELPRNLARLRLTSAGRQVFGSLLEAVAPGDVLTRLYLESAWSQCGGDAGAALWAALQATAAPQTATDRVLLACATARLAAGAPVGQAVAVWHELAALGPGMADAFSTNSHFYLSFLRLIDAIAAAHVHPERLLTPEGWASLEAEEHAVRMRIHLESRW